MSKQSSVEWFAEMVSKMGYVSVEILEQAKAMHKEESELLFECGRNFQLTGEGIFNQAYNETFGGDK